MTRKFLCMSDGCMFRTQDEHEARDHLDAHGSHRVVEIALADNTPMCTMLGEEAFLDEEEILDDPYASSYGLDEDEII